MKNVSKMLIVLFSLGFGSLANAFEDKNSDCDSQIYKYDQCSFEINKSSSGTTQVSKFESFNYSGAIAYNCSNGKISILKETCDFKPKQINEGDCAGITANSWLSNDGLLCSHKRIDKIVRDGESIHVKSLENYGSITYKCDNSKLINDDYFCVSYDKNKQQELISAKSVIESCNNFNTSTYNKNWEPNSQTWQIPDSNTLNSMCASQCENRGFDSSKGVSKSNSTSESKFSLECNCCTNQTTSNPSCTKTVKVLDNDSAEISNCLDGSYSENTQQNSNPPSNTEIQSKICDANGYYNLDSIVSIANKGSYIDIFEVKAICKGNKTPINSDACRGDYIGNPTQAAVSGVPYVCEANQCWKDKCTLTTVPNNMCLDCNAQNRTWNDSDITGGICNASIPKILTGQNKNIPFFNNTYNGNIDASCMNGSFVVNNSNCYLNCKDQNLSWGSGLKSNYFNVDKAGKCGFNLTGQNAKNDQLTSSLTSNKNTGDAYFRCNGLNGKWEVETQTCNLDCPSVAYWPNAEVGNVYDRAGREKGWLPKTNANTDMACSFNFGAVQKHGNTSTRNSNNTFNKGSATLKCNDGFWEVSGATCNLHCPAQNLTFGSGTSNSGVSKVGKCSVNVGKVAHGYNSSQSSLSNTGSVSYNCNDGKLDVTAQTCNLDCPSTIPSQTFTGGGRTCSINSQTVSNFKHNAAYSFRNIVGANIGTINLKCNDGKWDTTSSSCAPKPCQGRSTTWTGFDTCNGTLPDGVEGQTITLSDNAFTTGTATYKCVNTNNNSDYGEWILQSGSCDKGCNTTAKTWSSGSNSCSGNISATGIKNQTVTLTDNSYPSTGGGTGSASYRCNGTTGSWDYTSGSCQLSRNCVGSWSGYVTGSCNKLTGTMPSTRTYNITTPQAGIGTNCPYANGYTDTNYVNCPVSCEGSWDNPSWGTWSSCVAGKKTRTRTLTYTVNIPAQNGGLSCPNYNGEKKVESEETTVGCTATNIWTDTWPTGKYTVPAGGYITYYFYDGGVNNWKIETTSNGVTKLVDSGTFMTSTTYANSNLSLNYEIHAGKGYPTTTTSTYIRVYGDDINDYIVGFYTLGYDKSGGTSKSSLFELQKGSSWDIIEATTISCSGTCYDCNRAPTDCTGNYAGKTIDSGSYNVISSVMVTVNGACPAGDSCRYDWTWNASHNTGGSGIYAVGGKNGIGSYIIDLESNCRRDGWVTASGTLKIKVTNHTKGQTLDDIRFISLENRCLDTGNELW